MTDHSHQLAGVSTAPLPNRPVTIAVAPNGGRKTKQDHPNLPVTPEELAACAQECLTVGASMLHMHVRNGSGGHVLDANLYRTAIEAVRASVGDQLVIQITTEALGLYTPAEQAALVRATRPEAVSLALRELVPGRDHEREFEGLLRWMRQEHIFPQIILYDRADQHYLGSLIKRGVVPADDIDVLYVLGRYTTSQQSTPTDILPFLLAGEHCFSNWSCCAFGHQEAACLLAAALLGGNVRVGFENNLHLPDGSVAASNAGLIESVATSLRALGRTIETADGLRERLSALWR